MRPITRNQVAGSVSRRSFLQKTIAAAACGVGLTSATVEASRGDPRRTTAELLPGRPSNEEPGGELALDRVTARDFQDLEGSRFRLRSPEHGSRELILSEVRAAPPDPRRPRGLVRREPFALLFRSHSGELLGQGTYEIRHAELGSLPLFIVPVGPFPDGCRYEAIFN